MPDPTEHLNTLDPEQRRLAAEEYASLLVSGAVMGAASIGVVVSDAEVRRAYNRSTAEIPFHARLRALVRRRAAEQGVTLPEPLLGNRGAT